ncbi:MAG: hypothetical protein IJX77_06085 [Ruminococcus sp.]|nr:hypothetical protein [Ruminococcus sp.]
MKKINNHYTDLFNAAKIALSCVVSILIASYIGLKYSMTAGLITILSIQDTKKETVFTALRRLGAFFAAMMISTVCFKLMGFSIPAFGVYIFIFVIVCYKLEWKSAIVPISVLVTHLMGENSIELSLILNEFLIFVIGAGMGIIVNLHLRRSRIKMQTRRRLLDDEIKAILERMSQRILTDDKSDYNGSCFDRIQELLFQAEQIAHLNRNNAFSSEAYDEEYLRMRRSQCNVLYEMYKSVIKMNATPKQSHIISEFLYKVSIEYHEKNDVKNLMSELDVIFDNMRCEKMPESRDEFENRAVLYSLMLQLKEFLNIKYSFMQQQ